MENNIEKIRHSLSHVMAEAVLEFWPKTKLGMGPAIENGFYYDFQLPKPLEEADLVKIEDRMKELISQNQKFEKNIAIRCDVGNRSHQHVVFCWINIIIF